MRMNRDSNYVFRGGFYLFHAWYARAAYRNSDDSSHCYHDLGLRSFRRCP